MLQSIPSGRAANRVVARVALGILGLTIAACQDTVAPDGSNLRSPSSSSNHSAGNGNARIPDEYIVVFNDDVADVGGRANALLKANGGSLHHTYSTAVRGFSAHMSAQAAEALENNPDVAYVEQDASYEIAGIMSSGSESLNSAAWDLDRIDQRGSALDASYSWYADGAGVTAYIFDTGIRTTNVDFGGRASAGPDFISGGTSSSDCNGHGTHMAGKVAGTYWGVAKNVSVVAVRVLDCNGSGSSSAILAGLDWLASNHASPSVANLSFSGTLSQTLNQAVAAVVSAGVTVVAAAGDYGLPADACQYSPASAPSAITVGAMRQGDMMAGMSNSGVCVSLFAPGFQIASAWNTGDNIAWVMDGTSSSASAVSGAAAIYLSAHPAATPAEVKSALVNAATTNVLTGLGAGSPNRLLFIGDAGSSPPPPPPSNNVAPTASFTASCKSAKCTFNGSGSRDDVGIVSYGWKFGDGTTATTSTPSTTHTYTARGKYTMTVTLTVTDAGGLTGSAQKNVAISNGR